MFLSDFKYLDKDFYNLKAIDVVKKYYEKFDYKPQGNLLDSRNIHCFFADLLSSFESAHLCVINYFDLVIAREYELSNGSLLKWSLEDRDELFNLFKGALDWAGFEIRQVALIRNPINIYYSQLERFGKDRDYLELGSKQTIFDFFNHIQNIIKENDILITKYEKFVQMKPQYMNY